MTPSPVKQRALELGLDVTDRLADALEVGATLGVVAAYGRIIPVAILDRVPMLNVHFSLLPRWRGAAPVERAVLAGDATTGVCIMDVEEGLDTGGVYARAEVPIGPREGVGELRARLAVLGAELLVTTLAGVEQDGLGALGDPEPQRGEPTYAPKIDPSELELRWDRSAVELDRVVRLGRAHTTFRGRRLGVLEAVPRNEPGGDAPSGGDPPPGTLLGSSVVTGEGSLDLVRVRPPAAGRWTPVPGSGGAAGGRRGARAVG